MIYDDMNWHREGAEKLYRTERRKVDQLSSQQEFEVNTRACNHMALFLMWVIDNDLLSTAVDVNFTQKVADGDLSPQKYIIQQLNGQFSSEIFNPDLIPFMDYYYGDLFFDDYVDVCINENRPLYGFVSDEMDCSRLSAKISEAFTDFYSSEENVVEEQI